MFCYLSTYLSCLHFIFIFIFFIFSAEVLTFCFNDLIAIRNKGAKGTQGRKSHNHTLIIESQGEKGKKDETGGEKLKKKVKRDVSCAYFVQYSTVQV